MTTTITTEAQHAAYLLELAAALIRNQPATIARLALILERRSCVGALAKAETLARAAIGVERGETT